ncbi:MAG: hypothetical protein Tp1122DCM00d2C27307611_42 [Prokaryotic dsDNA virus sp.]|nr:MAG: hypothetical protein Tp1122DCM00d2C27307611_42 [Prokaryotic dsDNA virus sp.]|tara:strand:- start:22176 stop:22961 length:786 start_codon:yes stop_codon:yes gene_type:complete
MSLTGKTPKDTYKDLLYVDNSNTGLDHNARRIKSGNGTSSSLLVSNKNLKVSSTQNNTSAFIVVNQDNAEKFNVDTSNDQVKALGNHVNTQYAYFGISPHDSSILAANTHVAIPFKNGNYPTSLYPLNIGTGTDPDTTFTTANSNNQRASTLTSCMWYVPENISIDAVYSIEGADAASGDTTRMHLMSYTFTSGSTSALTEGVVLANNSDVTNAGSEQAYLTEWTINSAAVTGGKVILATFRQDGTNSDYTINITIKYHLT